MARNPWKVLISVIVPKTAFGFAGFAARYLRSFDPSINFYRLIGVRDCSRVEEAVLPCQLFYSASQHTLPTQSSTTINHLVNFQFVIALDKIDDYGRPCCS